MVWTSAASLPVADDSAPGAAMLLMNADHELFQRTERQRAALVRQRPGGVAQARRLRDGVGIFGTHHFAFPAVHPRAVERRGEQAQVVQIVPGEDLPRAVG